MKDEQGLLIQQKKLQMQQGLNDLNLWFQGERPAPNKPLNLYINHKDLYILRASFLHLAYVFGGERCARIETEREQ